MKMPVPTEGFMVHLPEENVPRCVKKVEGSVVHVCEEENLMKSEESGKYRGLRG